MNKSLKNQIQQSEEKPNPENPFKAKEVQKS